MMRKSGMAILGTLLAMNIGFGSATFAEDQHVMKQAPQTYEDRHVQVMPLTFCDVCLGSYSEPKTYQYPIQIGGRNGRRSTFGGGGGGNWIGNGPDLTGTRVDLQRMRLSNRDVTLQLQPHSGR